MGQGYYDNSIILNIFITTETQPKLTISFFSRPEKVPMRDMRISVHVLVHAGTMEKSTKWMKKWRPNPREKMAFLEIGLPKVDSLISVEPSPKFHNLWVARQKKNMASEENGVDSRFVYVPDVSWMMRGRCLEAKIRIISPGRRKENHPKTKGTAFWKNLCLGSAELVCSGSLQLLLGPERTEPFPVNCTMINGLISTS